MALRRRIPEETKASIQALKATTNLTLTEIAECCKVSTASVQRIITAKDKAPGKNRNVNHTFEFLINESFQNLSPMQSLECYILYVHA